MTKVLITGANSYIGTSFENYLKTNYPNNYMVDTLDMIDGSWRNFDFSSYDTIFHVAGIAHADVGKVTDEQKKLYYDVNTDLTIETAEKAKKDGVKQFVYMSSAIIYGDSSPIGKEKNITKSTLPSPANFYGDSKLKAEQGILPLQSESFNVVVLRPPMIYGKNSKGNYPILAKFASKSPVFPYVKNERSMLYIENLCEFVQLMIKNNEHGIFHPQNAEYSNTAELVKMIAAEHGKHILIIKGFSWALKFLGLFTGIVNKAFSNLTYDVSISQYKENYIVCNLKESIERTEKDK